MSPLEKFGPLERMAEDAFRTLARSSATTLAVGRPIRLSTPRTEPSPVMAAEQFLPPGKLEAVSVMDVTLGSLHLLQSRSQHPSVTCVHANYFHGML